MAIKTKVITNFTGRLTRILNGDLDSGFAKFTSSFGYDPFSKPMNLTWLETASDITGPINNVPQVAKVLSTNSSGPLVHMIDQGGLWYQIQSSTPSNSNLNSVIGISSVSTQGYTYGTSMEFYGSVVGADLGGNRLGKLYVGGDNGVVSVNPNGSGEATVGNTNFYTKNIYHPLVPFAGTLVFGNGNTIGQINATNTVISSVIGTGTSSGIYSALNPPLDTQAKVLDMDVSPSNDYVVMASSNLLQEERLDSTVYDIVETYGSQEGKLNQWNGSDETVTAATNVPTYLLSSIQTYFRNMAFFAADTFGTAFNDGAKKILSLPNNKPPLPNAVSINANFITWASPEVVGNTRYLSLYYYGSLDQENPAGLYRVLRWTTTQSNGFVSKVPLNIIVSNKYMTVNGAQNAIVTYGYGKHYIGVNSVNASTTQNFLLSFLISPSGTGTPQAGVYETQTQLFSKKVTIKQIRVYTEPTTTNNGFQVSLIGSDGNALTNGTFTYTYTAGTDVTLLQGALERIDYNPSAAATFSFGLRITNTGTANMTIKKIELDYDEEGK